MTECKHGVSGEPCPDCIKEYHAEQAPPASPCSAGSIAWMEGKIIKSAYREQNRITLRFDDGIFVEFQGHAQTHTKEFMAVHQYKDGEIYHPNDSARPSPPEQKKLEDVLSKAETKLVHIDSHVVELGMILRRIRGHLKRLESEAPKVRSGPGNDSGLPLAG